MGRLLIFLALAGGVAFVIFGAAASRRGGDVADVGRVEAVRWVKPVGAAVSVGPARRNEDYVRAFLAHYTSLTPENAMKWEQIQPRRGRFDFAAADALVTFAERHGRRVRGHPLVWDQQLPEWVTAGDWDAAELEQVLRDHVREVVGRYAGRVEVWDVVNEPLEDDGGFTRNVWFRVLGERYIEIALRAAREADPDATLLINEIAAEFEGPKAKALRRLVARLRRSGVPIDGVGLQNHTTARRFPDRERLAAVMGDYEDLGLDVEITEMDVALPPGAPLERQARAYTAAGEACAAAPNCLGLTVWGVTDEFSWIGADKRPLPLGEGGVSKPAFAALRTALAR